MKSRLVLVALGVALLLAVPVLLRQGLVIAAIQMLIAALEDWTAVTFVGEPSASRGNHFGDSRRIVLPHSHITVRVSTLYWQLGDPRDDRPWIEPARPAALSLADYAAGRDPALEAALTQPR